MVQGIYRGLPEGQLINMREERREQLQAAMAGRIDNTSKAGTSIGKQLASVKQLKEDLTEINAELARINPSANGRRISRLRASFSRA